MSNINEESQILQHIICDETSFDDDIHNHTSVMSDGYLCVKIEVKRDNKPSIYYRIEGAVNSKNILILYNGAYGKTVERKSEPVFQCATWVDDFGCLVINIDDPTIRLNRECVIGWGQGVLDDYFSIHFDKYLQKIYKFLQIEKNINRIHFGSSAGGYQAIVGASLDKGSRAVVCNPQIDWTKHFIAFHVDRLRNMSFHGYSIEALQTMHPDRCNCMSFAKNNGNIPSVDFYVNGQFAHDVTNQLNEFINILGSYGATELLEGKNFEIYITHALRGHNPPDKEETISYIKRRFV